VIFTNPPQVAIDLFRLGFAVPNRTGNRLVRGISDSANEAFVRCLCIAHEHENHPRKGHQASDNHERVEQVRPRRDARIGKMACQFENDNRAEAPVPLQPLTVATASFL
jgi:hypothetical protein